MKFNDKKYSHLEDVDGNKKYNINFYPYQLGFDSSYDDILLELTINFDNTMDLDFDNNTLMEFNNTTNNNFPICKTKQDSMLKIFKRQLLKHPYPNDELTLIFNK